MTTSADELLAAPRLKIQRAKHHIRNLNAKINAFLAEKPFKVVIQHKPQSGEYTIGSKRESHIPAEFALIAGDAIHNLCAALDHVIYAMAHDKAPDPFALAFPFSRKPERLEGRIASTQANFAGTYVVDTIRALQPYPPGEGHPGGNAILSGLHTLDNRDKHRLLILAAHAADFSPKHLSAWFPGGLWNQLPAGRPIRFLHGDADFTPYFAATGADYSMYIRLGQTADFENEADLQPTYSITFGEGQPFEINPVVIQLDACANSVEKTVGDLVAAFLDPKNKR